MREALFEGVVVYIKCCELYDVGGDKEDDRGEDESGCVKDNGEREGCGGDVKEGPLN